MVLITPRLVRPLDPDEVPPLPIRSSSPADDTPRRLGQQLDGAAGIAASRQAGRSRFEIGAVSAVLNFGSRPPPRCACCAGTGDAVRLADVSRSRPAGRRSPTCWWSTCARPGGCRRKLATLKRQHPATASCWSASPLDPALMLEGDARRRQRVRRRAASSGRLRCGDHAARSGSDSRSSRGQVFAFVGAKGGVGTTTMAVNVATALAKLSHEPRRCSIDLHLAYGDAAVFLGAEPRFSVRRRAREHAPARRRVLQEPGRARPSSGLDLLASSDRPATRALDMRRARLGRCSSPRRSTATPSSTCRARTRRCSTPRSTWRRSSSSRTRNWPPSATPAAWRRRCGSATEASASRSSSTGIDARGRDRPARTSRTRSAAPIAHQVPERLPAARSQALQQGAAAGARQSQQARPASFTALARDLAGVERDEDRTARPAGCKGLLSGRR